MALAIGLLAIGCGDAQIDSTTGGGKRELEIQPFGTCVEGGGGTIPADLDGALVELERILGPDQVPEVKRRDPIEFHHGLGTALRNCWGLWAGGSDLAGWFVERGIEHPDDMSSIVLTSLHRRLNGKAIDLEGQIAEHLAHWEKQRQDYESGASSGKAIFNLVELVEGAGWVSVYGENVPRVDELFTPLIEHARPAVEACWQKQPKTPGNSAVDTVVRISIDEKGRLDSAQVIDSAIPDEDAECLAQALVGAAVPEHKGTSYVIVLQSFRQVDPAP
jgi:hypothetical protein